MGIFLSGNFLTEIKKLAEDVAAKEGCYLYDLEFVGTGPSRALCVFIEKDDAAGVSIEDCTNVSRGLTAILDESEDAVPGGAYSLEVSSPGLERTLKEPRHYEKAIGKKISVKSVHPLLQFNENVPELGKAKQIQGTLLSFNDKGFAIAADLTSIGAKASNSDVPAPEVFVPYDSVTKAHVVFVFVDPTEKKSPKGGKGSGKKKGIHPKLAEKLAQASDDDLDSQDDSK